MRQMLLQFNLTIDINKQNARQKNVVNFHQTIFFLNLISIENYQPIYLILGPFQVLGISMLNISINDFFCNFKNISCRKSTPSKNVFKLGQMLVIQIYLFNITFYLLTISCIFFIQFSNLSIVKFPALLKKRLF